MKNRYSIVILFFFLAAFAQQKKDSLAAKAGNEEIIAGVQQENGNLDCGFSTNIEESTSSNSLLVSNHSANDAVLKLFSVADKSTVRLVYIKPKTSFTLNKIPGGEYNISVIFGKNLSKVTNGKKCSFRFLNNGYSYTDKNIFSFPKYIQGQPIRMRSYKLDIGIQNTNQDTEPLWFNAYQ